MEVGGMIYDISPLESQPRHWGVKLYDMAGAIFPMRKPSVSKSSSHNYSGWIMVTPRMSTRLDMHLKRLSQLVEIAPVKIY
jgi:hypothetical protein